MHEMMTCGHTANATCEGKPACVICSCFEVADFWPDLTGRQAKCHDCGKTVPSAFTLAFFEYRGEGSERATKMCKCGYSLAAHSPFNRINAILKEDKCSGFEAHGAYEFDSYYCGCRGWD